MASLNFPSLPINGQQYTSNNVTYFYDATIGAWSTVIVANPFLSSSTTLTGNLVIGNTTAWSNNVSLDVGSRTDAIVIPIGNTSQRPVTTANGMIRYNSQLNTFEGYKSGFWGTIGGGATGGATNDIFYENSINVTASYTITTGKNAISAGPITIDSGVTITVPSGSTWTIV